MLLEHEVGHAARSDPSAAVLPKADHRDGRGRLAKAEAVGVPAHRRLVSQRHACIRAVLERTRADIYYLAIQA